MNVSHVKLLSYDLEFFYMKTNIINIFLLFIIDIHHFKSIIVLKVVQHNQQN